MSQTYIDSMMPMVMHGFYSSTYHRAVQAVSDKADRKYVVRFKNGDVMLGVPMAVHSTARRGQSVHTTPFVLTLASWCPTIQDYQNFAIDSETIDFIDSTH